MRLVPIESLYVNELTSLRVVDEKSEEFVELVSSIRANGLLQPVVARYSNVEGRYEIVCGRRRYLACMRIGYEDIPCMLSDLSDREALEHSIVENLQRKNLDPIEEAEAFKRYLVNFGRGGISRLGAKIGKSEEYVSHRLLLLGLPKDITIRISRRLLKPSLATELIWIKDPAKQKSLAEEITNRNLSLRETRKAAKLIRDQSIDVQQAVGNAILQIGQRSEDPKSTDFTVSEFKDDPWTLYNSEDFELKEMSDYKHAILIVRSCLSGLDMLIDKTQVSGVRNLLMKERSSVHSILDDIIKTSLRHKQRN